MKGFELSWNFENFCVRVASCNIEVLRGTTKDAERASKGRSEHSERSGHSMIKRVANGGV